MKTCPSCGGTGSFSDPTEIDSGVPLFNGAWACGLCEGRKVVEDDVTLAPATDYTAEACVWGGIGGAVLGFLAGGPGGAVFGFIAGRAVATPVGLAIDVAIAVNESKRHRK